MASLSERPNWKVEPTTYGRWKKIFSDLDGRERPSPATGMSEWDWIDYLVAQRIAPYYYFKCSANGGLVPGVRLTSGLKRYYLQFIAANEIYRREAYDLLGLINGQGVVPLLVKGIQLQNSVYPLPGLRPTSDLDLIVRDKDEFNAAAAVLQSMGYNRYLYRSDNYARYVLKDIALLPPEGRKVMVELHHSLRFGRWDDRKAFDEPFFEDGNIGLAESGGVRYKELRAEANYLYLCYHSFHSHFNSSSALWINDIRMVGEKAAASGEDLDKLSEKTLTAGCLRMGKNVVGSLEGGTDQLPDFVDDTGTVKSMSDAEIMEEFGHLDSAAKKLIWLKWWVFPDHGYIRNKYGTRKNWLFIYYRHFAGIIKGLLRMRDKNE